MSRLAKASVTHVMLVLVIDRNENGQALPTRINDAGVCGQLGKP